MTSRRTHAGLGGVVVVALLACSGEMPRPRDAGRDGEGGPPPAATRLDETIRRAMAWTATLDVHPLRLREEKGMKGIKHMVEFLNFHNVVYRWSDDRDVRRTARERALATLRVTNDDAYHNLAAVDDRRFKQDSMSYLRACVLAEQFEADTRRYRLEIEKILPRLHAHLPARGIDQRMGFAVLFRQLGLAAPERETDVYPRSLIAQQVPMSYYLSAPDRPYDITHEIFAMTRRGTQPFPFRSEDEERYARTMVRQLLSHFMQGGNVDLSAEFLVNLAQLGEARSALARQAREFIFQSQNPDGSFGNYSRAGIVMRQRNPRYDVRIGGNLHTTLVCIWALVETVPD